MANVLALSALLATGCSFAVMNESELPLRSKPTCLDSPLPALADFAGAFVAAAKFRDHSKEVSLLYGIETSNEFAVYGLATGALIASGIYGLTRAGTCRQVKAGWKTGAPGSLTGAL